MIKCEVVFDGKEIHVNGFEIVIEGFAYAPFDIFKDGMWVKSVRTVEQAIKYCMEN